MDKGTSMVRRAEWRKLILECLQSGQTKKNWCKENGISPRKFYYWQKIIREEELALMVTDRHTELLPTVTAKGSDSNEPDFYEVPSLVHNQIIDAPACPTKDQYDPEDAISMTYKGFNLEIRTNKLEEALGSIIKVIDNA